MAQPRSPEQKAADAQKVFDLLKDSVTPPGMREVLGRMTEAQKVAEVGDVQAYAALVQAALQLQRVVAANDRTVMLAAAILTSGGVARPLGDFNAEAEA